MDNTIDQKSERILKMLEGTPDDLLTKDNSDDIFKALNQTTRASGIEIAAPTPGAAAPEPVAPTVAPAPVPPAPDLDKLGEDIKPQTVDRVSFKLKELFDPEFMIMLVDMALSFGGQWILEANDIYVDAKEIQADDFQKELLLKAYNPAFEKIEVGTANPLIAVLLGTVSVYSKNIMQVIKENKKKPTEPKVTRKPAVYRKRAPAAPKPKPTTMLLNSQPKNTMF